SLTDTAPPDISPLALHDALPIWDRQHQRGLRIGVERLRRTRGWVARLGPRGAARARGASRDDAYPDGRCAAARAPRARAAPPVRDRKSTRLNSSHVKISYAVFCL